MKAAGGMGPRRRLWERLKRNYDRLLMEARQFNAELASIQQNNPHCAGLTVKPIDLAQRGLPPMPPMPAWWE
jgi:hypothetical protein